MQQLKNTRAAVSLISWVIGALVASFVLLSCSMLGRAPGAGQIKAAATERASSGGPSATATVADVRLTPKVALPRSFRYAGLDFELQKAAITTQPPEGANLSDTRGAYAQLIWKITNPGTDSVRVQNGVFTLQLGGAAVTKAYDDGFSSQDTKDLNLVFSVPAGATWDNASLSFAEQGKVPATLPLEGDTLKDLYPQKLSGGSQAEVKVPALLYQVQSMSMDLDGIGQRAEAGNRYLLVQLTATCKDRYDCYVGPDSFRVLVDGAPYSAKTVDPISAAVHPDSSQAFRLAFQIPDQAKQVELQVGESGKDTAQIPVNLGQ